jgi:hypothetical protein
MIGNYDPVQGIGAYDILLRTAWSVFKYLEDTDQIKHMKFGSILFEGIPNYFSGWNGFWNMRDFKDTLLDPCAYREQFRGKSEEEIQRAMSRNKGGTNLDIDAVRQAMEQSNGKFWALIVSDGDIHNYSEAEQAVREITNKGNHLTYIETRAPRVGTGGCTAFGQSVIDAGGEYIPVSSPEDLRDVVLGKAFNVYSAY